MHTTYIDPCASKLQFDQVEMMNDELYKNTKENKF